MAKRDRMAALKEIMEALEGLSPLAEEQAQDAEESASSIEEYFPGSERAERLEYEREIWEEIQTALDEAHEAAERIKEGDY